MKHRKVSPQRDDPRSGSPGARAPRRSGTARGPSPRTESPASRRGNREERPQAGASRGTSLCITRSRISAQDKRREKHEEDRREVDGPLAENREKEARHPWKERRRCRVEPAITGFEKTSRSRHVCGFKAEATEQGSLFRETRSGRSSSSGRSERLPRWKRAPGAPDSKTGPRTPREQHRGR